MYIIISYITPSDPDSINLLWYDASDQPAVFETETEAVKYAEEMCCWKYKIVRL